MSEFYVLREMDSGEAVELAGVTFVVGREAGCNIHLDNPRVSRRHAKLQITRGELLIQDLESANGTMVNGQRIRTTHRLDSGDVVTIGGVSFLVFAPDAATGMTVIAGRIPSQKDSYVEDERGGAETLVSRAYALPPGWGDDDTDDKVDRDAAERYLSKQLIRERIAADQFAAVLCSVNGTHPGHLYMLSPNGGEEWLIGRGNDCDPRIDDATVSRHHVRVTLDRQGWRVRDLNSTNGCSVNGERTEGEAPLTRGDVLGLGDLKLLFRPLR